MIDYENGIAGNDLPEFLKNQLPTRPQPAEQRQVIRTKTLGNVMGEPRKDYKKIAEKISREQELLKQKEERIEHADEIKAKIIDEASEMRYLKHEVIEDADIVQISVMKSTDGTVVRKVPSDESIEIAKKNRKKKLKSNLDIQA